MEHCRRHVDCSGSPINLHWIPSFCWAFHSVHCIFHRQKGPLAQGMHCETNKQTKSEQFNLTNKCLHHLLETLQWQTMPPSDGLIYCRCHLVKQMASDARSYISTHLSKTYCTLKVIINLNLYRTSRSANKQQPEIQVGICVSVLNHSSQPWSHAPVANWGLKGWHLKLAQSIQPCTTSEKLYYGLWISENVVVNSLLSHEKIVIQIHTFWFKQD